MLSPRPNAASAEQITFNDFEALDGWGTPVPSLTTEQAHSGRFSIKVDGAQEYSFNYSNALGKASTNRISKLMINGWAMRAGKDGTATLVIEITDPAQNRKQLFWQSINFADELKEVNQWQPFKREFVLPAGLTADKELRVYLWRNSAAQPAYLDDLTLTRLE
ncbi:hypothetical protein MUN84_12625 [Hymenobacter sp. 5516J-16]|uniref:carbohydrate binding domain-containing protein n=1 Tax=Hymenobacter sp. 5516J-16 TaxID=2932253 RepID=UPI001FCF8046|nr:carbohydrate binding domain-containing protein [Hymenobacter sp. 5516J-16]UOQ75534.1 hypothetical protein MUN84_12625 [Hymenobacter sp. 5516J-16]